MEDSKALAPDGASVAMLEHAIFELFKHLDAQPNNHLSRLRAPHSTSRYIPTVTIRKANYLLHR